MPGRHKVGVDARNKPVRVEDTVIDKRGRAFLIFWTEKPLRKRKTVRAQSVRDNGGSFTFIRLQRVFRVKRVSTTARKNKARWRRFYDRYVRPIRREAARKRRRAEATTKMWPCPVCKNGKQPTKFKLGVPVWGGKRLRVCSTPCRRKVLKHVRLLEEDYDYEEARRRVAWHYARIGGQV